MKITRMMLRRWGACYSDQRIASLVPESGLTPLEIAELAIPPEDRMWVLLREEVIPSRDLRLLACGWAEESCRMAGWHDARSLAAIAVARRFAVGEATEGERAAVWSVAAEAEADAHLRRAAEAWSARAAMWSVAAEAEAWLVARASARALAALAAPAGLAECESTCESACESAWSSARAAQFSDVLRVLKG